LSSHDQHSINEPSYEELLKQYRDLQLRVTRFSAIEQELINTRDRLDHELVLHQRLHRYNSDALKAPDESYFFQIEAEAIVDVFEMEGSLVVFIPMNGRTPGFFAEGVSLPSLNQSILDSIYALGKKYPLGKCAILKSETLNLDAFFLPIRRGSFRAFQ